MGNPTSGILLLLFASLLIAVGMSGKGKAVLNILLNRTDTITPDKENMQSGGATESNDPGQAKMAKFPGAHVGEKGATNVS